QYLLGDEANERDQLGAVTKRPDKVIGMHFMNPPVVMQLVEIVRGGAKPASPPPMTGTRAVPRSQRTLREPHSGAAVPPFVLSLSKHERQFLQQPPKT
ncbi:MAG: hypothetical protein HYZ72_13725, partial [Deltaproteobacteria bacterium]|nr:hypothetical protein [Deltaproteobacteria bacterium]